MSIRVENSFSSNTKNVELADPITFMQLANEAVRTRNPLAPLAYSREKIDNTIKGTNPYVYPANDWRKLLVKDMTANQRVNMNVSGGVIYGLLSPIREYSVIKTTNYIFMKSAIGDNLSRNLPIVFVSVKMGKSGLASGD